MKSWPQNAEFKNNPENLKNAFVRYSLSDDF